MVRRLQTFLIKPLLLLVFIGMSLTLFSQQTNDTITKKKSAFEKINDKMEWIVKWFPLPMVSYNTQTNWLFGITKFNSFKIGKDVEKDTLVPTSTVTGLAYYTLNNQFKFVANSDLFFGRSGWRNNTQFIVAHVPLLYYGVGNDTELEDECLVTFDQFEITDIIGYNVYKRVYLSFLYNFNNYTKIDYFVDKTTNEIDCLNLDTTLSQNEGIQSGIGLMLYNEQRDNNINAHKGSFTVLAFTTYHHNLGSQFNYSYLMLDYRKYFPLAEKLTLATQFYSVYKFGDVPVQSLAQLGGSDKMRGIYLGRYRDKLMTVAQAELRFPIYWIISAVAFGGIGEVSPSFSSYKLDGIHWSAGAGLRLMVDSQHKANIRFDYGISSDQHFFFFGFGEAF
jgi:hypothetical protein